MACLSHNWFHIFGITLYYMADCWILAKERSIKHEVFRELKPRESGRIFDELRPVSFRVERNVTSVTCTINYIAQEEPEVLWFEGEGTLVPSSGDFRSGRGFAKITSEGLRFGFVLLKPFSNRFYIYTNVPVPSGAGSVWEYTYLQMDVMVEPGHDITYPNGNNPTMTILSDRVTGDIRVSNFVESYFYHPRDMWVYEAPSFLDVENDGGPIEHVSDVVTDDQQRFAFRIKEAFDDSPPQGVSIFNIMPSETPSNDQVIRYQLMISVSVHPEAVSSAPFPLGDVQLIDSRCDTNKLCNLDEPCRLTCLAVGNHIEKVEFSKGGHSGPSGIIVPHDTVYFKHVVDASLEVSGFNSSSFYKFKVTGREGYTDSIDVRIRVDEDG